MHLLLRDERLEAASRLISQSCFHRCRLFSVTIVRMLDQWLYACRGIIRQDTLYVKRIIDEA